MEVYGIFTPDLSRAKSLTLTVSFHSSSICRHAHDGHLAPWLPGPVLRATRRIFPLAPSLSSLDTDISNQSVSFSAAAEKSDFDRFIFRLVFFFFLKDFYLPSG